MTKATKGKNNHLTVGKLKKILAQLPDDLPVLLWGSQDNDDFYTSDVEVEVVNDVVKEKGSFTPTSLTYHRLYTKENIKNEKNKIQKALTLSPDMYWWR